MRTLAVMGVFVLRVRPGGLQHGKRRESGCIQVGASTSAREFLS
jgi:hypothetical protein